MPPSVLSAPSCHSLSLRRIASQQCSSVGTATASRQPQMPSSKNAPWTFDVSSKRSLPPQSGTIRQLCHFRPPSAAVLFAFVVPSLVLLLMGPIDGIVAMPNEWEEQRMCGRLLIQALKMVCNHQYAQPNRDNFYETAGVVLRVRRAPLPRSYIVKRHRQLLEDGRQPTAASPAAMGRNRRGIIWECCTNKCSLNYIRNNYCASPPPQGQQTEDNAAAFQLEEDERR